MQDLHRGLDADGLAGGRAHVGLDRVAEAAVVVAEGAYGVEDGLLRPAVEAVLEAAALEDAGVGVQEAACGVEVHAAIVAGARASVLNETDLSPAGPAPSASSAAGGRPGEPRALAREVGLVGVAGLEREPREVVALEHQEPLEPQDALERLGPVADGVEEPAPELPVADPDRGARRAGGGRADERVGFAALPQHRRGELVHVRDLRRVPPDVLERHAEVEQLGGGQAERRAGRADAEAHAEGRASRGRHVRAGGGPGDVQLAVDADDVDAGVGEDAVRAVVAVVDPQAGEERAGGRQLAVGHVVGC